jgi:hypothetical protein
LTQSLPAATTANSPSLIFSDAAEPSYGINAREPWFYGFLEVYAKVSMWLGTLTAFGLLFHVFIHVLTSMESPAEFFTSWEGLSLIFLVIIASPVILLMTFYWIAPLLLAIDIGRSLRCIHRNVRPQRST